MIKPHDYHIKRSEAALEVSECFKGKCHIPEHWKNGFDSGYESAIIDLEENYVRKQTIKGRVCIMLGILIGFTLSFLIGCEKQTQPVIIQSQPQQNCVTYTVTGIGHCIPNPQQCGNLPWCETVWNYNTITMTCNPQVGQQRQVCQ